MPLQIAKVPMANGAVEGRARLSQGVYDAEVMATSATTQLRFFSNILNNPDASGQITAKNYGDTNLDQSSQIPKGFSLQIHALTATFQNFTAGTVNTRTDMDNIILRSWLELKISQILIVQLPLKKIPFGTSPTIRTTATNTNTFIEGTASFNDVLVLKQGKYNPTIESAESFSATIQWPAAITPSVATYFQTFLRGVYVQPV